MVLRRRRLCYVIVCICVLDVTSSTNLSVQSSRDHTGRRGYSSDQRQVILQQQNTTPRTTTDQQALKTRPLLAAMLRCRPSSMHSSCLVFTRPEVEFFLKSATLNRAFENINSRQPSISLTSAVITGVKNTTESSSNKQHSSRDEVIVLKPPTETSPLSFHQPTFHHPRFRLLPVLGTNPNQVGQSLMYQTKHLLVCDLKSPSL